MGAGRVPAPDSLSAANTLAKFTEVNQHGAEAAGSHRGRTRPLCLELQSSASSSSRFGRVICRLPMDSTSSFLGSLSSALIRVKIDAYGHTRNRHLKEIARLFSDDREPKKLDVESIGSLQITRPNREELEALDCNSRHSGLVLPR